MEFSPTSRTIGLTLAGAALVSLTAGCTKNVENVPARLSRSVKADLSHEHHGKIVKNTSVSIQCAGKVGLRALILEGPFEGDTTQSIPRNALTVPEGPNFLERQVQFVEETGVSGNLVPCPDNQAY